MIFKMKNDYIGSIIRKYNSELVIIQSRKSIRLKTNELNNRKIKYAEQTIASNSLK